MSKQYLTLHTTNIPRETDVFSLTPTPTTLILGAGSSSIYIYSTILPDFPLIQTIPNAHPLGCHHVSADERGEVLVSVGFGGEVKVWHQDKNKASEDSEINEDVNESSWTLVATIEQSTKKTAGEIWAAALSRDGGSVVTTSHDGRVAGWSLSDLTGKGLEKVQEFETKGSFGLAVAMFRSADVSYLASSHHTGALNLFSLSSQPPRLLHSLQSLLKPARTVAFSPLGSLLAAGGDSSLIALYDTKSGEQIKLLQGHGGAWITGLDFSNTGEWLVSCAVDGRVKVWSVETGLCVATQGAEGEGPLWAVKWLPRRPGTNGEMFAVSGKAGTVSFYREASGG